jgi:transposase
VKLMAPKLVAPHRMSGKRGKNDAADAAAICEAVTRPSMRFVPLKDEHQQATLCLHRTRQGFVEERTAIYKRIRGLISEFGMVLPQSPERLRREIRTHLDALPGCARRCISDLLEHASNIEARLAEYDRAIGEIARDDERSRRLMQGDAYLRNLLILGARSVMASLGDKQDRFSRWVRSLVEGRGYWRAAVAISAKNVRMAWPTLKYGDAFKYVSATA